MFEKTTFEAYFHDPRNQKEVPVWSGSFKEVKKKVFQIVRDNEKADPFKKTFAKLWKAHAGWFIPDEPHSYYIRRGWYLCIRRVVVL